MSVVAGLESNARANRSQRGFRATPRAVIAVAGVFALHTLLTFHFYRPEVLWGQQPLVGADFDTHFGHASRFVQAMKGWGQIWSYDPSLLAGRPAGALFDCDNKAWNLFTYALNRAGVSLPRAFNAFVVVASLSIPWITAVGARLLGLAAWPCALFSAVMSLMWFFDSQTHYFWWIGMTAWALASHLMLLPLGFFYRYVRRPTLPLGVCAGLLLALTLLVHPFSFFVLVVPMGLLYGRARKTIDRRAHVGVWGIVAFAILFNGFWLWPALRFAHYGLESPFYSQAPIAALWHDFMNLAMDPNDTGMFMRSGFRFLMFGLGTAGFLAWRRQGDARLLPLCAAAIAMTAEAYLGRYTAISSQIQPYRFIVPATVVMTLSATSFLTQQKTWEALRAAGGRVRAMVIVLGLSTTQLLAHDVYYFFPEAVPSQSGRGPETFGTITPTGYPRHGERRHPRTPPGGGLVVRWFAAHDVRGRVLVESNIMGERLAAMVPGIEVMGGIRERNMVHALSNFFRQYPQREASAEVFADYLRRYGVRWVVFDGFNGFPEHYRHLLKVHAAVPDALICEVTIPTDLFASGHGEVRAAMNRIEVRGSDPRQTVVLRYHWLETLVCEPDCRVARADRPDGPLGFVEVPAPHPADFVIRNGY